MDCTLACGGDGAKFTRWVEKSSVREGREALLHYSKDELIIKLSVVFMKTLLPPQKRKLSHSPLPLYFIRIGYISGDIYGSTKA